MFPAHRVCASCLCSVMAGTKVTLDVAFKTVNGRGAQGSPLFIPAPGSACFVGCERGNCHGVIRGSELSSSIFYHIATACESPWRTLLLAKGLESLSSPNKDNIVIDH